MPTFHEGAKRSLQEGSEEAVAAFRPYESQRPASVANDLYSVATITESDLVEPIRFHFLADIVGNSIGLVVFRDGRQYAIQGDAFDIILRIADQVHSIKDFRDLVGNKFVLDEVVNWTAKRFRAELTQSLPEYLEGQIEKAVKSFQVWIPVPFTLAETDFELGRTYFRTITEARIREWTNIFSPEEQTEKRKANAEAMVQSLREKYQGHLAGTFAFQCERSRAVELAYENLSDSLAVLRLFSPANTIPELTSGTYEYGWHVYESEENIVFAPLPSPALHVSSGIRGNRSHWAVTKQLVDALHSEEYGAFHELIMSEARSQFEEKLLDAIRIYSRHTLRRSSYDKLLYVLTAIESILLKNDSEPIQRSLSDRIAFALATTNEDRRKVVQIVKDAYSIRSRYVHHGVMSLDSNPDFSHV